MKKTTGKISRKKYACESCSYTEKHSTNHYGKFYNTFCKSCGQYSTWVCQEDVPKGWGVPEEWKSVKLGDIARITNRCEI